MSMDESGPFGDSLFAAIARHHGVHDEGRSWHLIDLSPLHTEGKTDWAHVGERGVDSDRLCEFPQSMPRFRFARDKNGEAVLMVDGGRYILSSRGTLRQMTIENAALPDTLLVGAAGRSLSEYVDIPGAKDETISEAQKGNNGELILTLA